MKYQCKSCGRPLGYDGLCWKCRAEKERREVLAWTEEEICERVAHLTADAGKLEDWHTEEHETALHLIQIRGLWPRKLQRAALAAGVYSLEQLYYHAPSDVRDELIRRLMEAQAPREAARLMECLAMQGGDLALDALLELERHPRPWRRKLYVDPSVYAQCGGWTFDPQGNRRQLNFDTCYVFRTEKDCGKQTVGGATGGSEGAGSGESSRPSRRSPVKIGRPRQDRCPHCGCSMVDILTLDGRDERLEFLGIDGVFTASCCPNCVCFTETTFSRYTPDGSSTPLLTEPDIGDIEDYVGESGIRQLSSNICTLDDAPSPLFLGAGCEDLNTIGGFANWIQDWQYAVCPDCGKPMRYLAQIHWDTVMENWEGTLYIEFCPDCRVAAMIHQQT